MPDCHNPGASEGLVIFSVIDSMVVKKPEDGLFHLLEGHLWLAIHKVGVGETQMRPMTELGTRNCTAFELTAKSSIVDGCFGFHREQKIAG